MKTIKDITEELDRVQKLTLLTPLIKDSDIYQREGGKGVWMALIDIMFKEWNKRPKEWKYNDLVDYTENNYGKGPALALLVGVMNQQILNGGFSEYYTSGFASGNGVNPDCSMHERLLELLEEFNFEKSGSSVVNKILNLLRRFWIDESRSQTCSLCGGYGTNYNGGECPECKGMGFIESDDIITNRRELQELDDQFYGLSEKWIDYMAGWVEGMLNI